MIRAIMSWLASCLLAATAFPQAGQAATVELRPAGGGELVRYVAAPGERNDLTFQEIEESWPTAFIVRDTGASIGVGAGCVSVDAHTAVCVATSGSMYKLRARLGDGNDVLHPAGFNLLVGYGGPGDDRLLGGTWDDQLDGGGGTDELRGGNGDDSLKDGDRDSAGGPAGRGPDILDGGPGRDHLTYGHRTRGVRVDLADDRPDGGPSELDRLSAIESVTGGAGDDRLAGNARANVLVGGGGRNRLVGRGGDDELSDATSAAVTCGAGHDSVARVSPRTVVSGTCEFLGLPIRGYDEPFLHLAPSPFRRRGRLGFQIDCPTSDAEYVSCSAAIEIRDRSRRRLLASGKLKPNKPDFYFRGGFLRLTTTPVGAQLRKSGRHPIATVSIRGSSVPTARWTIRF